LIENSYIERNDNHGQCTQSYRDGFCVRRINAFKRILKVLLNSKLLVTSQQQQERQRGMMMRGTQQDQYITQSFKVTKGKYQYRYQT